MSHKIETIVYAQGFIENFVSLETGTVDMEVDENWDDGTKQDFKDTKEYHVEVRNMMKVLSEGLDQLRRENLSLNNKLALIDMARNTPT